MQNSGFTRRTALAAAFLFLGAAFHGPHADGHVLCLDENGRVDVEHAVNGSCVATHEPHSHSHPSGGTDHGHEPGHCGECTDIPLLAHEDLDDFHSRVPTVHLDAVVTPAPLPYTHHRIRQAALRQKGPGPVPGSFISGIKRSVSLQV